MRQSKTNIFIHWADGLQPIMKKIIQLIKGDQAFNLKIICLSDSLYRQACEIEDATHVISVDSEFQTTMSTRGVLNVLDKYKSSLLYSERHFSSGENFLRDLFQIREDESVSIELIRRCAYFCSLMEKEGGILLSEYRSDILSTIASLLQSEIRNFKNLTFQGSRLFSNSADVFFNMSLSYEMPIQVDKKKSVYLSTQRELVLQRTVDLLKKKLTSQDIYNYFEKNLDGGGGFKRFRNSKKVIFFPLQIFPENSTLGDCPGSVDQIWMVNHLSRALDCDTELWVKDHFVKSPMENNRMEYLKHIPNLRIVPTHIPVSSILNDIDLVVTISSSVGIEAIFRNKKIICFGNPIYKSHPLVHHLDILDLSINQLARIIKNVFELQITIPFELSMRIISDLLENLANYSYISPNVEGDYPFTDSVAKIAVSAIKVTSTK